MQVLPRRIPQRQAAVKDQFGKLQRTCKSCHDEFRNAN
ncbi:MAG: cytochrome c [Massilia sp.]|nr:cytochrome c [Massilia sp.]